MFMILVTAWNLVLGTSIETVASHHPEFRVLGEAVTGETQGEGF